MGPAKLEASHGEAENRGAAVLRNINLLWEASVPNLRFFLPLVKLRIEFEHLTEEVAWSYWLNFVLKIGALGRHKNVSLFAALLDTAFLPRYNGETV